MEHWGPFFLVSSLPVCLKNKEENKNRKLYSKMTKVNCVANGMYLGDRNCLMNASFRVNWEESPFSHLHLLETGGQLIS